MSDGAVRFVLKDTTDTRGEVKNELVNGKRSFTITISDDGQIEVAPSVLGQQVTQSKAEFREQKVIRVAGKQRIRIALIEEDAGSSDEEPEENYVVHSGLAKTPNKNVPDKPSFVVLDDTKVRKRFEDLLQASACLCNAQQQTSPCDIGAHTGSQTDDVRNPMVDAHSRGCQVTDARCNLNPSATKKKNLNSLNQLRIIQALQQLNDQSLPAAPSANVPTSTAPTSTAKVTADAPHVTISFVAPPSATPSVVFHPQMGLQQVMPNCCLNLPTPAVNCLCSKCCNCCCQLPPCMQHRNLAGATSTCCSSCSSLRSPGPCTAPCMLPEGTAQQRHQQQQDYRIPNWTRPFTPCPNCPLNPCNMCTCGNPNCPYCCMRRNCSCCSIAHQQETQKQQHQLIQRAYSKSIANMQAKKSGGTQPDAPSDVPKQGVRTKKNAKSKQALPPKDAVSHPPFDVPFTSPKFTSYPKIARRLLSHYPRHRAGGIKASSSSSKLYMARFGRTCLILKPTIPDATQAGDHDSPK